MRDSLRRLFTSVLAEGAGGGATVAITSSDTTLTATSPFSITITFSRAVTGFTVGDLTVGNGTAGNFAGSGAVYTADITPTADGTVTVDIAENIVNEGNLAATQFSIVSVAVSAVRLKNYSDVATLWKDASRTQAVTAEDDVVQGLTGLEATPAHDIASTTGPKYKLNLVGSLPGLYFDGAVPNYLADDGNANIVGTSSWTRLIARKQAAGGVLSGVQGTNGSNNPRVWVNASNVVQFNTDTPASQPALTPTNWNLLILQYNAATGKVRVRFNGSATWYEASVSGYSSSIIQSFTARGTSGPLFTGHTAGYDVVLLSVDDTLINSVRNAMNTYLGQIFFLSSLSLAAHGDSTTAATAYPEAVRDWMNTNLYYNGTFKNQALSGKHPFNNLVRLDAELLTISPDLVLNNVYQVMDVDLDPKCAEAIVRRIWTSKPTARQMAVLIPECDAGRTTVLDLSTQKAQCKAMYEYYGIPVIDFDGFCRDNIGTLSTYMSDALHPTATGQAQIATMIEDYFTAHPTFLTTTPDHSTLPAVYISGAGEYTTPAQRISARTGTETGTGWGNVGTTGRQSAVAGDTISFTADMVAFGFYDVPGTNPEFHISLDGGAFFLPPGGAGANGYSVPFESRAEHTVAAKVISGTLRVDEFWAI